MLTLLILTKLSLVLSCAVYVKPNCEPKSCNWYALQQPGSNELIRRIDVQTSRPSWEPNIPMFIKSDVEPTGSRWPPFFLHARFVLARDNASIDYRCGRDCDLSGNCVQYSLTCPTNPSYVYLGSSDFSIRALIISENQHKQLLNKGMITYDIDGQINTGSHSFISTLRIADPIFEFLTDPLISITPCVFPDHAIYNMLPNMYYYLVMPDDTRKDPENNLFNSNHSFLLNYGNDVSTMITDGCAISITKYFDPPVVLLTCSDLLPTTTSTTFTTKDTTTTLTTITNLNNVTTIILNSTTISIIPDSTTTSVTNSASRLSIGIISLILLPVVSAIENYTYYIFSLRLVYIFVASVFIYITCKLFRYLINDNMSLMPEGMMFFPFADNMVRLVVMDDSKSIERAEMHEQSCSYTPNFPCSCTQEFKASIIDHCKEAEIPVKVPTAIVQSSRIYTSYAKINSRIGTLFFFLAFEVKNVVGASSEAYEFASISLISIASFIILIGLTLLIFNRITTYSTRLSIIFLSFSVYTLGNLIDQFQMDNLFDMILDIVIMFIIGLCFILSILLIIFSFRYRHKDYVDYIFRSASVLRKLTSGFLGFVVIFLIVAGQGMICVNASYVTASEHLINHNIRSEQINIKYDVSVKNIYEKIASIDQKMESLSAKTISSVICPNVGDAFASIDACHNTYNFAILNVDRERNILSIQNCTFGNCEKGSEFSLENLQPSTINASIFYVGNEKFKPGCSQWSVPYCVNTEPLYRNITSWGQAIQPVYSIKNNKYYLYLPLHFYQYLRFTEKITLQPRILAGMLGGFIATKLWGSDGMSQKDFDAYKAKQDAINAQTVKVTQQLSQDILNVDNKLDDYMSQISKQFTNIEVAFSNLNVVLNQLSYRIGVAMSQAISNAGAIHTMNIGNIFGFEIERYNFLRQSFFNLLVELGTATNFVDPQITNLPMAEILDQATEFAKKYFNTDIIFVETTVNTNLQGYEINFRFQPSNLAKLWLIREVAPSVSVNGINTLTRELAIVQIDGKLLIPDRIILPSGRCIPDCDGIIYTQLDIPMTMVANEVILLDGSHTHEYVAPADKILGYWTTKGSLYISTVNAEIGIKCFDGATSISERKNLHRIDAPCTGIYSSSLSMFTINTFVRNNLSLSYNALSFDSSSQFGKVEHELQVTEMINIALESFKPNLTQLDFSLTQELIANLSTMQQELEKMVFNSNECSGFFCKIKNFFSKFGHWFIIGIAVILGIVILICLCSLPKLLTALKPV